MNKFEYWFTVTAFLLKFILNINLCVCMILYYEANKLKNWIQV